MKTPIKFKVSLINANPFFRSMPFFLFLENWPSCKQDKVEGGFLVGYHHQGICCENFTAYCADSFSKNNPGFEGVFSFAMECEIKYCCLTYLTFGNQYLFYHNLYVSLLFTRRNYPERKSK